MISNNDKLIYLHRAKLKNDNAPRKKGDWVFGDLVHIFDGKKTVSAIYGCGEVIESTIGAYTNIDIAGEKCFDKDILSVTVHRFGEDPHTEYYQVIFSKRFGMWTVANADGKICGASLAAYARDATTRIVGNMFDNSELLKTQAQ